MHCCVVIFSPWDRAIFCALSPNRDFQHSPTAAAAHSTHSRRLYHYLYANNQRRSRAESFADTSSLHRGTQDILTLASALYSSVASSRRKNSATTTIIPPTDDRPQQTQPTPTQNKYEIYQRRQRAPLYNNHGRRIVEGADWKKFLSFSHELGLLCTVFWGVGTPRLVDFSKTHTGCGGSLFAFALESLVSNTVKFVLEQHRSCQHQQLYSFPTREARAR